MQTVPLILVVVFVVSIIVSLPRETSAFWSFSNATASANIHDGSRAALLIAATNTDPSPNKDVKTSIQSNDSALIARSGLSETITDATPSLSSDSSGRISVYVVRKGDTLSEIANMFGISVNTIRWANNLSNARAIRTGDTLIILPISGIERKIVRGDTLQSLAKKYSADADEIARFNGIDLSSALEIGSSIIIPNGEITMPPAPTTRARPTVTGSIGNTSVGYYINPLPGGILTQGLHGWNGVDIGAPSGTPVYAAADGTVIIAKSRGWNGGYGNYVVIAHDNGTQTLYSHFRNVTVSPKQAVFAGQIIGYVGSSGRSTGPHLHFEVRGATNPLRNCRIGSVCVVR